MNRNDLLIRNVKFLMHENGIRNFAELSEKSGLQQPTLHRIVKGKIKDPTISSLVALGDALGVPFWSLIEVDLIKEGVTKIDTERYFNQAMISAANNNGLYDDLRLRKSIELAVQSLQVQRTDALPSPEEIARCATAIYKASFPLTNINDIKSIAGAIAHASIS